MLPFLALCTVTQAHKAFSSPKGEAPLAALANTKNTVESEAAKYKAKSKENPRLKKFKERVYTAYTDVATNLETYKGFAVQEILNAKNVKSATKRINGDTLYKEKLEKSLNNFKATLEEVYTKTGEGINKSMHSSGIVPFDPVALVSSLLENIVKWIEIGVEKRWLERQKLIEEFKDPRYIIIPYNKLELPF